MADKIVLNTSVFVSALICSTGASRSLLRECFTGKYTPLMGNALFYEYEEVSKRPAILERTPLTSHEVNALLCSFYSICEWISVYYLWRPNLKDEYDNHVIELAVSGHASMLVTHNIKDFKGTQLHFPQLAVLTPEQLIGGH